MASQSIALGDGVDEDTFLTALEDSLPALIRRLRPSFVFYIAGCDPAHDDKLGTWQEPHWQEIIKPTMPDQKMRLSYD